MGVANILVVDDDPETCQLLSIMLEKKHFHVETAYCGIESLEKVHSLEPDLVVLDIMLPDMDGWETCRRMKAISDVPILFLSALTDMASVARGFKEGGNDYICKPFQTVDLTTRIEKALQNGTHPHLDMAPPPVDENVHLPDGSSIQILRPLFFFLKRLMDILIAGIALVTLSPLMLLIAVRW